MRSLCTLLFVPRECVFTGWGWHTSLRAAGFCRFHRFFMNNYPAVAANSEETRETLPGYRHQPGDPLCPFVLFPRSLSFLPFFLFSPSLGSPRLPLFPFLHKKHVLIFVSVYSGITVGKKGHIMGEND